MTKKTIIILNNLNLLNLLQELSPSPAKRNEAVQSLHATSGVQDAH